MRYEVSWKSVKDNAYPMQPRTPAAVQVYTINKYNDTKMKAHTKGHPGANNQSYVAK